MLSRRSTFAILWFLVAAGGLASKFVTTDRLLVASWFAAVWMTLITAVFAGATDVERGQRTPLYRFAAIVVLFAAAYGLVIGLLPQAAPFSRVMAVYFGFAMVLAVRAIRARGLRPALLTVAFSIVAWLPLFFAMLFHKGGESHWTEGATLGALQRLLWIVTLFAAVSLVSWRRDNR